VYEYTEREMGNTQGNNARNLWDKAITILPRALFERWLEWTSSPD
jgi:hypothetical protein